MAMMKAQTSRCSEHGHPEFRVLYDPSLLPDGDQRHLLDALEQPVDAGTRFAGGDTFQFGWMVLEVKEADDGSLSLFEPDMIHTPIHWVESVTHALIHLRVQREVCASVAGMENPHFPSQLLSARICDHLGTADGFFMERGKMRGGGSGWILSCSAEHRASDNPKDFLSVTLYEAVVGYEPRLLPYLALAEGVAVDYRDNAPAISLAGNRMMFNPGSRLETRFG